MKVKTSDLIGPALDWAVSQIDKPKGLTKASLSHQMQTYGNIVFYHCGIYSPSTDWAQGGQIIELEEMELHVLPWALASSEHPTFKVGDKWEANIWPAEMDVITVCGPTPLIAAMRCYVASKLGETVEIPEELLK